MGGMANPENIDPYKIRSTSEARAKGRAGGLRSGARRRELASLKEAARIVLSMDSVSPKSNQAMELMGLDPDERTNAAAITATMVMRAVGGDVKAYEALSKNMALLEAEEAARRGADAVQGRAGPSPRSTSRPPSPPPSAQCRAPSRPARRRSSSRAGADPPNRATPTSSCSTCSSRARTPCGCACAATPTRCAAAASPTCSGRSASEG